MEAAQDDPALGLGDVPAVWPMPVLTDAMREANPNSGHGHVFPRPDGAKMRCGGPAICPVCAKDASRAGWCSVPRPAAPPAYHEAYAALHTALIGSGVLPMDDCEAWARRILEERG